MTSTNHFHQNIYRENTRHILMMMINDGKCLSRQDNDNSLLLSSSNLKIALTIHYLVAEILAVQNM